MSRSGTVGVDEDQLKLRGLPERGDSLHRATKVQVPYCLGRQLVRPAMMPRLSLIESSSCGTDAHDTLLATQGTTFVKASMIKNSRA